MKKIEKIWSDPVGSKIIAEIIKWSWGGLIIPLYAIVVSLTSKTSFLDRLKRTWNSIVSFFIKGFQINFLTIAVIIISYAVVTFLFRRLFSYLSRNSVRHFTEANIWGAIIKWKWEKKDGHFQIKYKDYELVCPTCSHNLEFDELHGQHFLKCKNLSCNFQSGIYHYQPPSGVFIMADMSSYYFHSALTSTIDAEIRKRGLKK